MKAGLVGSVAKRILYPGVAVFSITGGHASDSKLNAREAATKARQLRRGGVNDVEIFRSDGTRISLYALDQLVREGRDGAA